MIVLIGRCCRYHGVASAAVTAEDGHGSNGNQGYGTMMEDHDCIVRFPIWFVVLFGVESLLSILCSTLDVSERKAFSMCSNVCLCVVFEQREPKENSAHFPAKPMFFVLQSPAVLCDDQLIGIGKELQWRGSMPDPGVQQRCKMHRQSFLILQSSESVITVQAPTNFLLEGRSDTSEAIMTSS